MAEINRPAKQQIGFSYFKSSVIIKNILRVYIQSNLFYAKQREYKQHFKVRIDI